MRSDHAIRHNAAVGAVFGLAVGEALVECNEQPQAICGGGGVLQSWGPRTDRALAQAEAALRSQPVAIDLSAIEIVPTAILLSDPAVGTPLLVESEAAEMCAVIRDALSGQLDLSNVSGAGPLTEAAESVHVASTFAEAITRCSNPEASILAGAVAGARFGPGSIPSAWSTHISGPVGTRTYRPRQLRRLAERLLRFDAPAPPEPHWYLGPHEVAPKLWLSNLPAVPRFIKAHPEGAVVSLCPTTGAFDQHPYRREFAIHDAPGRSVNPHLSAQIDEVLATIDAFHAEGRDVLVHCHHGASRTGLILRAWLMHHDRLSFEDSTAEAQARWPKTSTWNDAFARELRRREA